ncbi:hypothetical protein GGS26DRAFT_510028 [Hypomontagnella submonticulosa]|nr:hypothetical protein GGS26DRAFT_510028 [Hypomontagnella submonticulosa]
MPAPNENNPGDYLECNGILSFADYYLPRAPDTVYPPAHRYVSPGMQPVEKLEDLPPAAVFTCGFDLLRDVGLEFAEKLQKGGNRVAWRHYPTRIPADGALEWGCGEDVAGGGRIDERVVQGGWTDLIENAQTL